MESPEQKPQSTNQDYLAPWEREAAKTQAAKKRVSARVERAEQSQSGSFIGQKLKKMRKWFIWTLILALIYWFYHPHGIFVFGDPLSVGRYRSVLSDLKKHMPAEYELVRDHIDKIKISYIITGGNYAGYAQEGERGSKKITLLENTFVQGPGYAHSVLVHEACHGLQFERKLPFSPFCENQAREHACNQWGIKVLKQFKADEEMLNHYLQLAEGDTVYGNSCLRKGKVKRMPAL